MSTERQSLGLVAIHYSQILQWRGMLAGTIRAITKVLALSLQNTANNRGEDPSKLIGKSCKKRQIFFKEFGRNQSKAHQVLIVVLQ